MGQRWDNSDRVSRLPGNWASLRLATLRRDHYLCQGCGAPATEVDHVIPGDDHSLENLQSLCTPCHAAKTRREGVAAQRARRAYLKRITTRPPEKNPGEIPRHRAKPGNKGW